MGAQRKCHCMVKFDTRVSDDSYSRLNVGCGKVHQETCTGVRSFRPILRSSPITLRSAHGIFTSAQYYFTSFKFYFLAYLVYQPSALYNHELCIIIIGIVVVILCHLCTPAPGKGLDIETSYLVYIPKI